VNGSGTVAFVGTTALGQGIFVGSGSSSPKNIGSTLPSPRTYSLGGQINDSGSVIARSASSGASHIQIWFDNVPRAVQSSNSSQFETMFAWPSLNNPGDAAWGALDFNAPAGADEFLLTDAAAPAFPLTALRGPIPKISDDDKILVRANGVVSDPLGTDHRDDPIRIYEPDPANPFALKFHDIASTKGGTPQFTALGGRPGIVDLPGLRGAEDRFPDVRGLSFAVRSFAVTTLSLVTTLRW
jgi:hypothetical protein